MFVNGNLEFLSNQTHGQTSLPTKLELDVLTTVEKQPDGLGSGSLVVPVWRTWSALRSGDWSGWQTEASRLAPAGFWFWGRGSTMRRGPAAHLRCHFLLRGLLPAGPTHQEIMFLFYGLETKALWSNLTNHLHCALIKSDSVFMSSFLHPNRDRKM